VKEVRENDSREFRRTLIAHSLFFLLGISVVYLSLGLGISYLGNFLTNIMTGATAVLLQRLAGIFMVVLGLVIGDWLKIPGLLSDTRKNITNRTTSFASSFFIGLGFAAGWTPCIGPIFSGILLLGLSTGTTPVLFLLLYIIGFSIPFLLVSLFLGRMPSLLKHSQKLMKIGGVLMIIMGVLLFTGQLEYLSEKLSIWLQDTPFQWLG
jgi:cytochrome c-type biogenesis protein